MTESIHIYQNSLALSEGFTAFLKEKMNGNEHFTISLSGGSTPMALFDYWAEHCQQSIDWQHISFFWGDERCVPPTDQMSNYGMTKKHLFDKVQNIHSSNIHRIHGENSTENELKRYDSVMNKYVPKKNDIPCFDLMVLGLGDDGHTASIFPHQISLWDNTHNCVEAEHPESKMKRISLTGRVVNNSTDIVFLVTGKNKAEKVKEIIEQRTKFLDLYPAARVNPAWGHLHWFLDENAAEFLGKGVDGDSTCAV